MPLADVIANSIRRAVVDVFSTMLHADVYPTEGSSLNAESNEGIVSFVGLIGAWSGTGSLRCSPALGCRLCSRMLETEITAITDEVLDTIAELSNMIIGTLKTDLEPYLGHLRLSTPTVVFGRNFQTKTAADSDWVIQYFQTDGEDLLVRVCLAPCAENQ